VKEEHNVVSAKATISRTAVVLRALHFNMVVWGVNTTGK
jgi:hypothetical protein